MSLRLELHTVVGRPGLYDAVLDGRLVVRSREPFFDAARLLLAQGHGPSTVLEAVHAGSTIVAMRATLGEAAKWRIEESDRGGLKKRPWRPFDPSRKSGRGNVVSSAHGVPENARSGVEQAHAPSDGRNASLAPVIMENRDGP